QLFEEQAERQPEALAVLFGEESLTYRELNARANQLAHHLKKAGVRADVMVPICLERSLELMVGLLGILKAGGAYVALDPAGPSERVVSILEDLEAPVIVTSEKVLASLPELASVGGRSSGPQKSSVLCLDIHWKAIARESREKPSQS